MFEASREVVYGETLDFPTTYLMKKKKPNTEAVIKLRDRNTIFFLIFHQ